MRVDVFFTERFSGRARVCVCVCVFQAFFVKYTTLQAFLCTSVFGWVLCKRNSFPPLGFPRRKSFGATAKTAAVLVLLSLCVLWSCTYAQVFLAGRFNHQQPFIISPGLQMLPPVYCDCYCFRVCVCVAIFVRLPEIFSVSVTGAGEQSSRI